MRRPSERLPSRETATAPLRPWTQQSIWDLLVEIRVPHTLEPEFGWHFVSPEIEGMVDGGSTYVESRNRPEYLVRVHLAGRTETDGTDGRTTPTVRFVHVVEEQATELRIDEPVAPPVAPPF